MSRLVGRESELARLTALLDDAVSGRGRLVLLSGPAGIGTSRPASELIATARGRGGQVGEVGD